MLDDCVKARQAKFWQVCASMDAEGLCNQLTIVRRVMHQKDLPGVSKFPVDQWVQQGQPAGLLGAHTDRSRGLKARRRLRSKRK